MKKSLLLATVFSVVLFDNTAMAADKNVVIKKETAKDGLQATDLLSRTDTMNANVRFVETLTVMSEGELGQVYRAEIEAKRDAAMDSIQEETKKFEKSKNEYMAKASTMTDSAREKEEKKLMKADRDIKNMVKEGEEELRMEMQIASEKLVQDLEVAVIELAKEDGVHVVFDKTTGRAIYVSDDFDYTDKVLNKVNENHHIRVAQSKKQEAVKVADNKKAADKTIKS